MSSNSSCLVEVFFYSPALVDWGPDVHVLVSANTRICASIRTTPCRLAEAELEAELFQEAFEHAMLARALYPDSPLLADINSVIRKCVRASIREDCREGAPLFVSSPTRLLK